jgi:hypothetical protein
VPSYTKKGGVHVKGYSYLAADRGHPGRGPKLIPTREGLLYGWTKKMPAGERRRILRRIVRREGYATAVRRLNALRNKSTDRETDAAAKADMLYLQRTYRKD